MRTFQFIWRDGSVDEGSGTSVADAFTRLGFAAEAISALDYYKEVHSADTRIRIIAEEDS